MMRRIVSAALPSHVAAFRARQLEDASVLMTFSGDDALTEVRSGRSRLLLLDSDVPGLPAESVLLALREDGRFDTLGVV
jgi:DNA-binding response OmpR family regulator